MPQLLPSKPVQRKWTAIALAQPVAAALAYWSIYVEETYGLLLFVWVPFLLGFLPVVVYGHGWTVDKFKASMLGLLSLGIFALGLLVFAWEGLICIAMAAPFAILSTWIGSLTGWLVTSRFPGNSLLSILLLAGAIPLLAAAETGTPPEAEPVTTSVVINASPEEVWEVVVAFPQLDPPTEWLFRAGIAYPIDATIDGSGVGAVRHCNFNTGSFVEPITVWDPPHVLGFDVQEQPLPMREISFWDVDAPHLHDYFVSRRGEFRLTEQADGTTLLEGTTWYYHDLRPAFYWRWWSNAIVHAIHERVLNHVKAVAEKGK